MKAIRVIVMILIIIGALNWGLIGFFEYDLLAQIFGGMGSTGARTVFGLIGLAGLFAAIRFVGKCCCKHPCGPCGSVCRSCGKENCECRSGRVCKCCGKENCECGGGRVCKCCGKEDCECKRRE